MPASREEARRRASRGRSERESGRPGPLEALRTQIQGGARATPDSTQELEEA